jgi:hypothetical protein
MLFFRPVAERMEEPMRIAMIAASLALAACATSPRQASADLDSHLDALIGQPVAVALARLGDPIAAAPMGPDTVYGWGHAFTSTEVMSALPDVAAGANAQGGIFPPPRSTVQNDCVIRIVAGADGLIRSWDAQGNYRGCRAYRDRLAGEALARAD